MIETILVVAKALEPFGLALISLLGAVQVALINNNRKHTKAVREQAENSHGDTETPNLRDNIDANQNTVVEKLNKLLVTVEKQDEKLDGVIDTQRRQTNKLDRLFGITTKHTNQINEMTQPKGQLE